MNVEVMRWQIQFDFVGFPGWNQYRYVVTYVDDVTYAITVKVRDGSDNIALSPLSGPSSLYQGTNGMATRTTIPPFYQYCDGTTLRRIGEINSFPYAAFNDFPNHSTCQIAPVCDLEISSSFTTVDVTDPDSTDGEIQVSATSSNGVIKYGLDAAFDYASGNTTGLFTGLLQGTYTVYAKDEVGCMDSIDVKIGVTTVYGIRYRGEYDTVQNDFTTKIEILQRGYDGEVEEVCFSGTPFVLDYDSCDKFSPFVASHCVIELLEESENQFLDLFQNDDRKYRIDYYKDFSGYELQWSGFVIPEFYQKPFTRAYKNYVTVKASDQLGQMKEAPFVDTSENNLRGDLSQLQIITEILRKTDLFLNIRIQDNIFEESMETDETPLAQAYADTRIFYEKTVPKKCDEVLEHTIKCKSGLRLFQSKGYWWLVRSEYNTSTFDYFEYDFEGTLVATSTYAALKTRTIPTASPTLCWANASQIELFETNYGNFELTHNLNFDDNLIDEGRFEEEDIVDLASGDKTFKNWSVTTVQNGLRYGLEKVENGDSKGAFFMDFKTSSGSQADNMIYSIEIPVETNSYGNSNLIKLKFQYKGVPYYKIPWILLRWQLRYTSNEVAVGTSYLKNRDLPLLFIPWTSDVNESFNDIYISNYDSFQTFEITAPMRDQYGGTIRLSFYMHDHRGRDFANVAALKAFDTFTTDGSSNIGKRVISFDAVNQFTDFYELENSDEAESLPEIVRPDDFVASGSPSPNPKVWKLKGRFYSNLTTSLVYKFLLDNVQLTYIPFDPSSSIGEARNYQPPAEVYYDQLVNKFNKVLYSETFLLGDLPTIENGRNLYRGYLRLADGTPTSLWYRNGVTEASKLLTLALNERVAQLKNIQKRIQADLLCKGIYYAFVDSLSYDSRRFINGKYFLDDVNNIVSVDLLEMTTGADGEPPVETGAFSTAYSDDFDNI